MSYGRGYFKSRILSSKGKQIRIQFYISAFTKLCLYFFRNVNNNQNKKASSSATIKKYFHYVFIFSFFTFRTFFKNFIYFIYSISQWENWSIFAEMIRSNKIFIFCIRPYKCILWCTLNTNTTSLCRSIYYFIMK